MEIGANARVDTKLGEGNFLKLLCGEELAQGEDELPDIDLPLAHPADLVVVGAHALDRQQRGVASPLGF